MVTKSEKSSPQSYVGVILILALIGIFLTAVGWYYCNTNITLHTWRNEDYVEKKITSFGVAVPVLMLGIIFDALALLSAYYAIKPRKERS